MKSGPGKTSAIATPKWTIPVPSPKYPSHLGKPSFNIANPKIRTAMPKLTSKTARAP